MAKADTVVVADAGKARIFLLTRDADNPGMTRLEVVANLANPLRRQLQSETYSESRPGSRQAGGAHGPGHAVDDRRDSHDDESDRQFAKAVGEELGKHKGRGGLIVAASPRMLGLLRDAIDFGGPRDELDKNLSAKTGPEIHDYLAERDLLPPRGRA